MLKNDILNIKGLSQKRLEYLNKLGISSIPDLLTYFPKSYQDYSVMNTLDEVFDVSQKQLLVKIEIISMQRIRTKSRIPMHKILIRDDSATATLISFGLKQNYLNPQPGKKYIISGIFKYNYGKIESNSFHIEAILDNDKTNFNKENDTTQILPFYPLTSGLNQKLLRSFIKQALILYKPYLKEVLPQYLVEKHHLLNRYTSFKEIHFPSSFSNLSLAKERFKYTELFRLQFQLALKKLYFKVEKPQQYNKTFIKSSTIEQELPFLLTLDQKKALKEIELDLKSSKAMHRLLMGDVGSGKTLIAILSLVKVIENGFQGVLLAPTEVLAKQHFKTIEQLLYKHHITIELLLGSTTPKNKINIISSLKNGDTSLLIGTHAVFSENVEFKNLGLVVIDEQHKFGVEQRMSLIKKGYLPDVLLMSATPIPRTLGYIHFGDMDISILQDKPVGRLPIKTQWLEESDIDKAYTSMKEEISKGHQGYIVYPLVYESEKLDIKSIMEGFEFLKTQIFQDFKMTLLHGQMDSTQKQQAIQEFSSGKTQILVSTMIIEVGVDVPNATCMIIEHANRFGLSTLHQLRGRVGRNSLQSYCFVVTNPQSSLAVEAIERMKIIEECDNGFILAEKDMELRGIGNLLGKSQSGKSPLKISNLVTDQKILELAREDAFSILTEDPLCKEERHHVLHKLVKQFEEEIHTILHT